MGALFGRATHTYNVDVHIYACMHSKVCVCIFQSLSVVSRLDTDSLSQVATGHFEHARQDVHVHYIHPWILVEQTETTARAKSLFPGNSLTSFTCSLMSSFRLSEGSRPNQIFTKQAFSHHMIPTYVYASAVRPLLSSPGAPTAAFLHLPV